MAPPAAPPPRKAQASLASARGAAVEGSAGRRFRPGQGGPLARKLLEWSEPGNYPWQACGVLESTFGRGASRVRGERVVFRSLKREGFLDRFRGERILEVGPKHGEDSLLLAGLTPAELVLIDLPEKRELVHSWLAAVEGLCPTRYVEANLLYLSPNELEALGEFDLIFCLGVIYHNVEQLRLLRRLFNLCATGGVVVVESSTTRDRRLADLNVVEIHWPQPYRDTKDITHHPSRRALESWREMTGFVDIKIRDVYSPELDWQRAVLTAVRPPAPRPFISYASETGPTWIAGEAT